MLKHGTAVLSFACALAGAAVPQPPTPPLPTAPKGYAPELWAKAWRVHHEATVLDTHSDTTSRILDEGFDMGPRASDGHMDLPRISEGGLDAQFYSIYVASRYFGDEASLFGKRNDGTDAPNGSARRALDMIDGLYRTAARYPDRMMLCTSVADIRRAAAAGRHAALMGIEGGHAIEGDLALLRMFHRLGIRYMTLTHTNHNHFADSCAQATPRWGGLNRLGVKVVEEMNRLGMLVDVSHVADPTFWDVLRVTRSPVILSHSSARALCADPRNITDEMMRGVAENGGAIMINFNCGFLDGEYQKKSLLVRSQKQLREREARRKFDEDSPELLRALDNIDRQFELPERPPLQRLMDHILHAIRVAGVDHVGLGSDFDGVPCVPKGMDDVTHLPRITYHLLEAGLSDADVRKVLGDNLLRVFLRAEQVASDLRHEPPFKNDPATDFERLKRER